MPFEAFLGWFCSLALADALCRVQFGKFHRIAQPGFNCICCLLGEPVLSAGLIDMAHECITALLCSSNLRNVKPYVPVWDIHHWVYALGETVAGTLSLRLQQLDVRCETKTRDNASLPPLLLLCTHSYTWALDDAQRTAPAAEFHMSPCKDFALP